MRQTYHKTRGTTLFGLSSWSMPSGEVCWHVITSRQLILCIRYLLPSLVRYFLTQCELYYTFDASTDEYVPALVRWPPMGRKKYMFEGAQRGRNELIQDSIYRDTGISRDRKQVSSHLQVLKGKLQGFPAGEYRRPIQSFPTASLSLSLRMFSLIGPRVRRSRFRARDSQSFESRYDGFAVAIRGVKRGGCARGCQNETNRATVLVYMATPGGEGKRNRANAPSHANQSSYLRGHQPAQRTDTVSKYEYYASSPHLWQQFAPQSDLTLGAGLDCRSSSSPSTVLDFSMVVEDQSQEVHCFSQLHPNGRLDDLNVTDMNSWCRQHYEFDFLRSQPDDWRRTNRKVLVCDASIKVMTESRPSAHLHVSFNLHSYLDLSTYESLECTTRFFDSGNMAPDPQLDNPKQPDLKEHRTPCEYTPDPQGQSGRLTVKLGSGFCVHRMSKYLHLRHKDERYVRDSLLRLTAIQDVYGIKPGGEAQCLFTILWRFQQTKNSAEVGTVKWRSVNFAGCQPTEQQWIQEQEYRIGSNTRARMMREADSMDDLDEMEAGHEEAMDNSASAPVDLSLYHQASQLPLDFAHPHPIHHSYEVQLHHPPPLSLDILASMQPDLDHINASASTTAMDFSHQSFAFSHTQDTGVLPSQHTNNNNDFDFNGGQITISGAFEPVINLSAYDTFVPQDNGLESLHALADDGFADLGLAVGENGELVAFGTENDLQEHADLACYSTKPNWQHSNLISHLENAVEHYHAYLPNSQHDQSHGQAPQGHEALNGHDMYQQVTQGEDLDLHDGGVDVDLGQGLWSLASPFHKDTGSGAVDGEDCRKEQAHGLWFGVLNLIERDVRARGH
jgi:transcriptional enhancer factor